MRITMQTINNNILSNINRITTDMAKLNDQVSSGRQMSKLSDNPVNLTVALSLRTNLNEITQYQENLSYGTNKIEASESSLSQIKEQIIRAKELAIQAANATMTTDNRALLAPEVGHLFEQTITLGNTDINGQYIFGGYRTTGYTETEPAPFIADKYDGYRLNGNAFATVVAPAAGPTPLAAGALQINGIDIGAAVADSKSTTLADASAEAVAKVINDISDQTGVTAEIIPAQRTAVAAIPAGNSFTDPNDLIINGEQIFPTAAAAPGDIQILANDSDNTLISAINAKSNLTGVTATNDNGTLVLSAADGRNIQIEVSANGETITNLNGVAAGSDATYFGAIQLRSDEKFQIKTAAGTDATLTDIGLGGGTANTGEPDDLGGDGEIWVRAIANRDDSVRYTGDRNNDLEIKVSKGSTLAVTKRGNEALSDTGVFAATKRLEFALLSKNFTEVTSTNSANDKTVLLNSDQTGLLNYDDIAAGSFNVTITDHDYYPPRTSTITIPVDPTVDTLESMKEKLNGVPNLNASWDADDYLQIETTNADRYTVSIDNDSSNFLNVMGIDEEDMQVHALENSIGEMNTIMDELSNQISDFGARANRIEIQGQILTNMKLSATTSLSDMQDTDMAEAFMALKTKQFAYEAALTAAAKTMQLSLVNFL